MVTRAEFARRAGVSRAAITIALRNGRLILDANKRIDLTAPSSVIYIDRQKLKRAKAGKPEPPQPQPTPKRAKSRKKKTVVKARPRPKTVKKAVPKSPSSRSRAKPPAKRDLVRGPDRVLEEDNASTVPADVPADVPPVESPQMKLPTVAELKLRTEEITQAQKTVKLQESKIAYLQRLKKLMPADWHYRSIGRIAAVMNNHFRSFAERHADELAAMSTAGAGRAEFFSFLEAEINTAMTAVQNICQREIDEWKNEELSA